MKTSVLALFLSQLVSLSIQAPVTTDPPAVTHAPTQSGALSNCSSWYVATPGDDCNTLRSMIGLTDVARDFSTLHSLNPQIFDCRHDVWAGYRYCVKMPATTTSNVAASTSPKPPAASTTSQVAASTTSKPPPVTTISQVAVSISSQQQSVSTISQVAASSSSAKWSPTTTVVVMTTVPTLTTTINVGPSAYRQ